MDRVEIGNKLVVSRSSPILIAEIGINHGGSLATAKAMARMAVENGADIIKHQTHVVSDEMSSEANAFEVSYVGKSIYKIIEECALTLDEEVEFKAYVEEDLGSTYLSTPFSRAAADFLNGIDVPAFKIGSGECNNRPLLAHISSFKKPIILSTGMNDLASIKKSVDVIRRNDVPLVLMHTTNSYPCPDSSIRLLCIKEIEDHFDGELMVGFSDHSVGPLAAQCAVALGAPIVEKHFTDSFDRDGPDIECSMDPAMCREISQSFDRIVEMRTGNKGIVEVEKVVAEFAFSSVCSIVPIKKGDLLTTDNIWVKRPGTGDYSADDYESLLGKVARKDIETDTQISADDV